MKLQTTFYHSEVSSLGHVMSRCFSETTLNIQALNAKSFYPKSWEKFCQCVLLPFTKKKRFTELRSHVGWQDQFLHSLKGKCKKRERLRVSQIYREVCATLGAWGLTYWRTPWWGSMTLTTLVRTTSFLFSTKFCLAYSTCMDEPRLMTSTAGMRIINKNARNTMMPSAAAGESGNAGSNEEGTTNNAD